jgi:hypothetical protein
VPGPAGPDAAIRVKPVDAVKPKPMASTIAKIVRRAGEGVAIYKIPCMRCKRRR